MQSLLTLTMTVAVDSSFVLFVSLFRLLESNIEKVLAGRTGVRFFFPLCGKAVDMKWYVKVFHRTVSCLHFLFHVLPLVWVPGWQTWAIRWSEWRYLEKL